MGQPGGGCRMAMFSIGDVVLVGYPDLNAETNKLRPAVALKHVEEGEHLFCMITAGRYGDARALPLTEKDVFLSGLNKNAFVRPTRIFIGHAEVVKRRLGLLSPQFVRQVETSLGWIMKPPADARWNPRRTSDRGRSSVMSHRKVIVAVDDMPANLLLIKEVLGHQFDVRLIKSSAQVLPALTRMPADLVLLDIEMPGLSGFDVLEAMRENPATRDMPVIFVTSHATKEFVLRASAMKAANYIVKPFKPGLLMDKVLTALGMNEPPQGEATTRVSDGARP